MAQPGNPLPRRKAFNVLLERAETQGFLTHEDFCDVYPQLGDNPEHEYKLATQLRRIGVLILEDSDLDYQREDEHPQDGSATSTIPGDLAVEDTVEIYLREMARVPLLSMEEEVSLAQCIERGLLAGIALQALPFNTDADTRHSLERDFQDGIRAREHIIKANTRLVVSIAKRYTGRGVPFLDLIQEGNLGLMKAVEKFDYRRGFRFSTYATWWIRQTITRAIADQGRTIRLPVHMNDRIRKLYRTSHELEQSLGRPPTTMELAEELQLPEKKIQWMLQVSWIPLSLESPVGDEDDSELGMFVEDETSPHPTQALYQNMLRERVNEVLASLTPREARILRLRYGLDNNRPYTLEEVGEKFGLTRERIRQIEGKALRRLRSPCYAKILRDCI